MDRPVLSSNLYSDVVFLRLTTLPDMSEAILQRVRRLWPSASPHGFLSHPAPVEDPLAFTDNGKPRAVEDEYGCLCRWHAVEDGASDAPYCPGRYSRSTC